MIVEESRLSEPTTLARASVVVSVRRCASDSRTPSPCVSLPLVPRGGASRRSGAVEIAFVLPLSAVNLPFELRRTSYGAKERAGTHGLAHNSKTVMCAF